MSIDELIRQAKQLPPELQLQLAAHLVEFARKRYPTSQVRPQGSDIQGSLPDPLVVQSCQVSETRITERKPGLHPGAFIVHDDFDEPLPDSFWLSEA